MNLDKIQMLLSWILLWLDRKTPPPPDGLNPLSRFRKMDVQVRLHLYQMDNLSTSPGSGSCIFWFGLERFLHAAVFSGNTKLSREKKTWFSFSFSFFAHEILIVLVYSLSSHRHSYIHLICNSRFDRFVINNVQVQVGTPHPLFRQFRRFGLGLVVCSKLGWLRLQIWHTHDRSSPHPPPLLQINKLI
jgi:hypothetical protein